MTSHGYPERVPGARREKMRGYLRAANELRQTYQAQLQQKLYEEGDSMPGNFPDVEIVRSGEEEMVLFPSYARKHIKTHRNVSGMMTRNQPGSQGEIESHHGTGDADYWRAEWARYEDANAVVDVDVRGWIYSPQKGPLNRKNRLLIAVARRLSGIPAPNVSPGGSRSSSQHPLEEKASSYEEEAAAREAEYIARKGQREANAAWRGTYSLANQGGATPLGSRSNSPERARGNLSTTGTDTELASEDEDPAVHAITKRQSWNEPASMSKEELIKANELLMARLKPFMTLPLASTTITVFFFNEQKSRSKSVTTNESGHFNVRAALDFVPTHVRVLASENLSATEEVIITEESGVSLISDVDDTIKHSAISSGAREIFKNTFIRELGDLTVEGVREWYSKLAEMGVKVHYVSNSPWQLFPLLQSYFSLAGLPPGSFHLKQYSGMLQGIFEPAAERKRGSLERIMNDFPDRKFILVGDSGEADLEVYVDIVLANPGRVLAIFIRDVTTSHKKGFFDHSMANGSSHHLNVHPKDGDRPGVDRTHSDAPNDRPPLPSRPKPESTIHVTAAPQEDLIDFSDEPEITAPRTSSPSSYANDLQQIDSSQNTSTSSQPPTRPAKPSNLRQFSTASPTPTNHDRIPNKDTLDSPTEEVKKSLPPPRPRRSSKSVDLSRTNLGSSSSNMPLQPPSRPPFSSVRQNQSSYGPSLHPPPVRPKPVSRTNSSSSFLSSHVREDEGYVTSAKRQLTNAYNALPALRSSSPSRDSFFSTSPDSSHSRPIAPRRGLTSYPAAAARWAAGTDLASNNDASTPGGGYYNKKEEMWRRRWARAEDIMRSKNVILKTWRVGSDVMDECVKTVEKAMRDIEHQRGRSSARSGQ